MTIAPWPPDDRSTCQHCGAHVTDRAHRCGECDTYARLSRCSGAGVDVEIPDPETSPGRHGGEANA